MSIIYKDINLLSQKASLEGTEKFPVSDTEYVTADQLANYGGAPDISSSMLPNDTPTSGANIENLADVNLVSEFSLDQNRFEIEEYTLASMATLTKGRYGMSDETGTYMGSQSTSRHCLIYMEPGDYIQITPKTGYQAWFAFVKNFELPVEDGPIPFAGNSFVNRVEIGQTVLYKAPAETVCVRVHIGTETSSGAGDWSLCPQLIKIYRDKERLTEELLKGNGRREIPVGSANYFNNTTYNNGFCFRIRAGYNYCFNVGFNNQGTGITKALGLCQNIPGNVGYNIYSWTTSTTATTEAGSNFLGHENFGTWTQDSDHIKAVEKGNTWGFMVVTSASANCVINNIKVYEIDPFSEAGNWSRIENTAIKGIARNQSYTKIDLEAITQYSYQINAPLDTYGVSSTSTQRRVYIPVTEGQFVRVVYDSETARSVREFAWFTEVDSPSSGARPPLVSGTGAFSAVSVATQYDSGDEFYLQAPSGAKYLSVFLGTTSAHTYMPQYVGVSASSGGGGSASSSDERADINIATTARRIETQGQVMGLTPIAARPLDSNGWEIPQTIQQLNTVKKCKQCINIQWTPKHDIPGKNVTYTANVLHTSLPYSSASEYAKNIGGEVSLNTFMTAVNNPYSLLYTENIKETSSASAWGYSYHGTNGATYYGQVCCAFSAFANGQPTTYNNPDIPRNAMMYGSFVPLWNKYNADSYQIGDVGNNQAHSFVIMGLKRDSSGHVTTIRLAESTSASSFDGNRYRDLTPANFYTYLDKEGDPFDMFRISNYYCNIDYKPCKYFPLTEYGEPEAASYNNDICTFAGDEACFMEGDLVVINYNLTSTPSRTWTAIEVYKNNELYGTYTLSSIDQNALAESQKNHALSLGTTLPGGMYKARLKDASSNYSDYTYWEVISDTMSIINNGDGSWTFSADLSTPIIFIWIGTDRWNFFVQRFARELDWYEKQTNSVTLYIDKTMRDWGREDPALDGNQVRLLFKGTYGTAVKVMNIPGRHD